MNSLRHRSAPMVTAIGIQRSYGARSVLSGIDLSVERGEFVVVIGHSGAGKTTLLRILAGLDDEFHGEVAVSPRLSLMFQDARLLPWQRVAANVALGLRGRAAKAAAARALTEVGLAARGRAWPRELSGGEVQRVALARALARGPEVLLLDEPFGALDALTRSHMQALLSNVVERHRTTTLLVTHDLDEALGLADRILTMDGGMITADVAVPLPRPRDRGTAEFAAFRGRLLAGLGVAEGLAQKGVR
ncbi:ABC transporter ATP-binding protein [Kribbella shirazensis]|uniref:Sulfonate transport system ATP-binding protein n=1 Tax=Kribbella shirazensis TaxID=1105143 RepID=A0A7X5VHK6_9ACTN|nr:ABC transporter ATP-binding protein [Kribbella shirazensis]NIK61345.1 sulfonate transport system ATP-binding protein [Kribbella shirazensis]